MVWVKLDDDFYHHPKIRQVGPLGVALQVASLCYSNHFATKGFIGYGVLETLVDFEHQEWQGETLSASKVADWLVSAGMWDEDKTAAGFWIHDYEKYQEPTLAEKRAEAGRRGGLARAGKSDTVGEAPSPASTQATPKQLPKQILSNTPKQSPPVPVPVPDPLTPSEAIASSGEGAKTRRSPAAKRLRKELTDEQRAKLLVDFQDLPDLREEIDYALSHVAHEKSTDDNLYLRHWLRGTLQRLQQGGTHGNRNNGPGRAAASPRAAPGHTPEHDAQLRAVGLIR